MWKRRQNLKSSGFRGLDLVSVYLASMLKNVGTIGSNQLHRIDSLHIGNIIEDKVHSSSNAPVRGSA